MSLAGRLYRGETNFDLVGRRKIWFTVSALLMIISIGSMATRGFALSVDFKGGNTYQVATTGSLTLTQVSNAVTKAGAQVESAQEAGNGSSRQLLVTTAELSASKSDAVKAATAKTLGIAESSISDSHVSSSWGSDVSTKALQGLIAFLILVTIYIAIRFEARMAIAAMLALLHDLVLSAGIYSLVGFEVTPSTIVGLLTILGFSLYDTVVVFDKVAENTRGILGGSRQTYSEAANLAVNQTFMRSINTSLISLLPVAGLLFVGAGILGVGTLKDLALVLFVGLATGAYSSLFLATPLLTTVKERERPYAALRQRVLARRAAPAAAANAVAPARARKGRGRTGTAVLDRDDGSDGSAAKTTGTQKKSASAKVTPTRSGSATSGSTVAADDASTEDDAADEARAARRRRREARVAASAQRREDGEDLVEDDDPVVADEVDDTAADDSEPDDSDIDDADDDDADHDDADHDDDADEPATAGAGAQARRGQSGRAGSRPSATRRKGGRPAGKKRRR